MFSERFEFFKVLTYRDTMIKYVDAMQKSKSVAREWRQSDYFAIFVWASKQFASSAGEIINFHVFLAKGFFS